MHSGLVLASFLNPQDLLTKGGLLLACLIIFAESGLFFGFFLPGDSLLFVAGFLASAAGGNVLPPLPITAGCLFLAAVAGDQVGFWFGRKVGPALFKRPDSRLFKQANVTRAHAFFEKHGPRTIVLARFVPVVRTFAPIVAGVGGMRYRTFVRFNLIGALLWAVGITTLGYYLGEVEFIKNNIEIAVVGIVVLSLIPVTIEFLKHRRERKHGTAPTAAPAAE